MTEPRDAEFERKIRREIHARYKAKAAQNAELYKRLMQAQAKIRMLELMLEDQAELVELAEKIITEGTPENGAQRAAPAGREDGDDQQLGERPGAEAGRPPG